MLAFAMLTVFSVIILVWYDCHKEKKNEYLREDCERELAIIPKRTNVIRAIFGKPDKEYDQVKGPKGYA